MNHSANVKVFVRSLLEDDPPKKHDWDAAPITNDFNVGDHFQCRTKKTSTSGSVTKVNRSTVEYETRYFDQPMTLRDRKDVLVGSRIIRAGQPFIFLARMS
jgi:hypothetical protein